MRLMMGDCLERMSEIEDGSVDAIICDPPYGTTDCKWDSVIPFEPMWEQVWRVLKPNGAAVFTASQPFTSALVMSQVKRFKTSWVWNKKQSGGFATAKYHPLKVTEDVIVFSYGTAKYYPIMRQGKPRWKGGAKMENEVQSGLKPNYKKYNDKYYPVNIIEVLNGRIGKVHPTQKPVELMEYLIRTYSKEGETVLDFTMGSGTTGVACANTNRNFIGIERDATYFQIAKDRIEEAQRRLL